MYKYINQICDIFTFWRTLLSVYWFFIMSTLVLLAMSGKKPNLFVNKGKRKRIFILIKNNKKMN